MQFTPPWTTPDEADEVRRRIKGRIEGKDTPPPLGWPTHGGDRGEGKDGEGGNSFFTNNREMIYHHVSPTPPSRPWQKETIRGERKTKLRAPSCPRKWPTCLAHDPPPPSHPVLMRWSDLDGMGAAACLSLSFACSTLS